ncbi:conserved hypothetical protein [Tenacibaculum sp. 190524A02b]|uniref:Uncharacterized protein n=1 Tax=Tenacibaculum vairaonense TaxID=3137860 RepID=A0ABP1FKQ1_9FLAO
MKYYSLEYNKDRKIIGVSPQSQTGHVGDIQQDFIPFEGLINFDFNLPEPILEKKAKLTSYINVVMISGQFLVIDDDFLCLLKEFNIGNNQSWKLKVWQEKKLIKKYNLFFLNDIKQNDYINYSKSKFYIGTYSDFNYKGDTIKVESYKDLLIKREKITQKSQKLWLREEKIVFDLRGVKEDMFKIMNSPRSGYYISERLKEAIEEKNLTGMSFTEIGDLKNVEVIY